MGGLCDFSVTPAPIGLGLGFRTALGLGLSLRGPDLGLGLDNSVDSSQFCGCAVELVPPPATIKTYTLWS